MHGSQDIPAAERRKRTKYTNKMILGRAVMFACTGQHEAMTDDPLRKGNVCAFGAAGEHGGQV